MNNPKLWFYRMQSNNLNLDYLNVLTNQIDFCFSKLYLSTLIRTKIECITKQLLVDINWPSKAIFNSALIKQQNMFCSSRNKFNKHGVRNCYIQNHKFVTLNSSRKYKILVFFTLANWDTMGAEKRKHVVMLFNHSDKHLNHLAKLFKLSVKFLVFSEGFKISVDKCLKNSAACLKQILGPAFCRRELLKIWSVKSTIYSLKCNLIVCNLHFINSSWNYFLRH